VNPFTARRLISLVLPVLCGGGFLASGLAQTVPSGKTRLFLWEGKRAPTTRSDTAYGSTDSVKNPWLLHYPATNPNGTAVIVIPGGGYDNLSPWGSEGTPAATKLNTFGVTAFILRYRVKPFQHPVQMWDVQRAVRWVRAHAAQYGINPNRIGVLGFSAGGHVASTGATHFDAGLFDSNATNGPHWYPGAHDSIDLRSSRPDFQGLVYAMTTMVQYRPGTTNDEYAYGPGRTLLLGSNPSASLVDYTSNEKQVTPNTPPAWLNWGTNDNTVDTLNSAAYRDSLISKGVAVKTLVIQGGGHDPTQTFRGDSLQTWMNSRGYLTAIAPRARRAIPAPAWVASGKGLDVLGRLSERPTGQPLKALRAHRD
jgi:acetyl esterase/lipase